MSILNDLVRARAERMRMATNPDQFAARGEPWQMPADEAKKVALGITTSRKIRKGEARLAKVKEPIFRDNPRAYPAPSETLLAHQRERELIRRGLTAGTGNPNNRTLVPATKDETDYFLRIHTNVDTRGAGARLAKRKDADPWDSINPVVLELRKRDHAEWLAKERAEILARRQRAADAVAAAKR